MKNKILLLPNSFNANSQKYLKYFLIFTAWPVFSIGLSITLYLFIFLLIEIKAQQGTYFLKSDSKSSIFYLFAFASFISMIFAPWDKLPFKLMDDIQMQIQYIYWMLVAVFFMHIYNILNKSQFNKIIFIGLLLHLIHFFFFNERIPIPFFRTFVSRNGFIYTLLALWPLASGYVYEKYGKVKGNWSLFFVFFITLLTDGRAGVVIILIENIFIYFIYNKSNARVIRALLVVFIPILIFFGSDITSDENRESVGKLAENISPRIGEFIKGEGTGGDLTFDKSWLTRRLMISKGVEIIADYPLFGVGIGHYTDYSAELADLNKSEFSRLGGDVKFDEAYYNKKSAHNSYVHIMSEMGLVGFFILMFMLVPVIIYSVRKLYMLTITKDDLILVSLIGICIHFYTITTLPGTVTWFVIGLSYARIYKSNSLYKSLLFRKSKYSQKLINPNELNVTVL